MRHERNYIHAARLVLLLVVGFTGAQGCASDDRGPEGAGSKLSDFTTSEILQGLVLADGPVAAVVPTIRDNLKVDLHVQDPAALQHYRALSERVMASVMADHAGFAERFRSDILSGDHVRIQRGIQDAVMLVKEEYEAQPEFAAATAAASGDAEGRGLCVAVGPVFVAYAAAFNWAAALVNVVAAANAAVYLAVYAWNALSAPAATSEAALMSEQIVGEIAVLQ